MKINLSIQSGSYEKRSLDVDTGSTVSKEELEAIKTCCESLHSGSQRAEWGRSLARQIMHVMNDEKGRAAK